MHPFFKDDGFQFAVEGALGDAYRQATDVGEILSTIGRIPNGDATAWVTEWSATGERLAALAREAETDGHRRSAAARWLRASSYWARATDMAESTSGFTEVWERHRDAWDRFVDLTNDIGDTVIERVAVPYEDTTLPGHVFRTPGTDRRRTLVFVNGSDGSVVEAWTRAAAGALARGWAVATVDGPGQNAALVRQRIPFRPDWEAVLTPLLDQLLARPDVDPDRIAVMGLSQGGFWVPRAVAHEHRVAAAVADPGVLDVSTAMTAQLPGFLQKLLDAGEREKFDLRLLHRRPAVPALGRGHRGHPLPDAAHRPRARAVLARAGRPARRRADLPGHPHAVHRGGGRGRALRAARPRAARRADPGLARRPRARLSDLRGPRFRSGDLDSRS
jgi:dienelactone hydrolase